MQNEVNSFIEKIKSQEDRYFKADEDLVLKTMQDYSSSYANISVKILSVLGGIFATAAFMGFLMLTGLYDSGMMLTICGLLFIAASVVLNNRYDQLLLDTFTITLYVMGFVLLVMGFEELKKHENHLIILCLILSAASLIFAQNYMLTLVAVLIFNGGLAALFAVNNLDHLMIVLFMFFGGGLICFTTQEAKIISISKQFNRLYQPMQSGFFISFTAILLFLAMDGKFSVQIKDNWAYSILIWMATVWLVWRIIMTNSITELKHQLQIFILAILFLLPSLFAPYIAGSVFLLVLTFHYGFRTEFYTAIVFLIYSFSQYYYDLNLTLLAKSGILFFSGLLLILARIIFNKQLHGHE